MRRLREHPTLREMLTETVLEPRHLILPFFVVPGTGVRRPIASLPGLDHWSVDRLPELIEPAREAGVRAFLLFGVPTRKDATGSSADEADQPVQRALSFLKGRYPEAVLISDVCLCEYTDHGHCGCLTPEGRVDNDRTLERLASVAASHARAGADIVAPSDMMDGRVAALRARLDGEGFGGVGIMSYAAKFASAFYGPFRDAAGSAPSFGDRRGYQLSPANPREAMRDALMDVEEGADFLIVKPAGTGLDIARALRDRTDLPLAGYMVSGEYMMLRCAIEAGALDRERALREYHLGIRRAGCDWVITYFALELARLLTRG
jgi:porphobilinogen synthase